MSLNQRQWDILCKLQSSDKPLTSKNLVQLIAATNKGAKTKAKSFREMVTRDLRDLKRITGAIESKKVLSEDENGHAYRENAYSWKDGGSGLMVNALTSAQAVALGVLQKIGLGLVPKALADELKPLFTAIHTNQLVRKQSEKDLGRKIPRKATEAAEDKWLKKIAILSETVGFVAPETIPEVEMQIHEALYDEELIEIHYRDKDFIVKPLALVQRGVRRYLVGIKRGYGSAPTYFTMSRIKKVKQVQFLEYDDVQGGEDFDLEAYLKKGLAYPVFDEDDLGKPIHLKLWVDEGTYGWISETPLNESQTAKKVKDGYELSVNILLREELVFWILSMANHVRVIGPKLLKDRVADDLKKSAALYL